MDRIVVNPLKVDFHIHSCYSRHKDYELVENNTIDNLDILIDKLAEYQVNMCAITDHDYFSYEMYHKLKGYEGLNGLLKVFPGVEFTVSYIDKENSNKVKPLHIICIFDDEDEKKVNRIESILFKDGNIDYDFEGKSFSEEKFISILREINLNVIMIVHQKNSLTSKSIEQNDLNSLSKNLMNELLYCEYFEALEFKNMRNGIYNKKYALEKNKHYNIIKLITGSDCHQWEYYPKHDEKSNDEEATNFHHSYLKCLPCFRGLAMAFSDYDRISQTDSIFSHDLSYISNIDLEINNKKFNIPLSRGINAIIGDNSIGKSMLIHKLTNYEYLKKGDSRKKGYESYLKKNNISINTLIEKNQIFGFDGQGSIRERFNDENHNKVDFIKEKMPLDLESENCKTIINKEVQYYLISLNSRFQYHNSLRNLQSIQISELNVSLDNLVFNPIYINKSDLINLSSLVSYFEGILIAINKEERELVVDNEEKKILLEFEEKIKKIHKKYLDLKGQEEKVIAQKNIVNICVKKFEDEFTKYRSDIQNKKVEMNQKNKKAIEGICESYKLEKNMREYEFKSYPEIKLINQSQIGNYIFIKKYAGISELNSEYFKNLISRTLKKGSKINYSSITEDELKELISDIREYENDTPLRIIYHKVQELLKDDLLQKEAILLNGKDIYQKLSNGLNSTIYFELMSNEKKSGIYIVDQPEDDVSQTSIKNNIIKYFKNMSNNHQIILITHNPQFVVNLDVDNVIHIHEKDQEIHVDFGALEYQDENTDILQTVSNNLDGGIQSIRKRWKRYEKADYSEEK